MARLARVMVADVAYHVTQRGNGRQYLLAADAERTVYLELLRQAVRMQALSVVGYCLMSNHVHLVVIPHRAEALAAALKSTHGRYAAYWNARQAYSGHAWQGRFYSCPLDEGHLWQALRYTERNPVRASLVTEASAWNWSSAAAHAARRSRTSAWILRSGAGVGRWKLGGHFCMKTKPRRNWRNCGARPTRGVLWDRRSLSSRLSSVRYGP